MNFDGLSGCVGSKGIEISKEFRKKLKLKA
jgi:hypothetical protein